MHGFCHLLPGGNLLLGFGARRTDIALADRNREYSFRNDQSGAGTLCVVGSDHVTRHTRIVSA
ncbi:hypothetical protein D9M73_240940 [compost metagenome]